MMKNAAEWLAEKCNAITVKDVIDLQNDARKDAFMTAQAIASEVITRESYKYATPGQAITPEMTLNGLDFFVGGAITDEADKLKCLPGL